MFYGKAIHCTISLATGNVRCYTFYSQWCKSKNIAFLDGKALACNLQPYGKVLTLNHKKSCWFCDCPKTMLLALVLSHEDIVIKLPYLVCNFWYVQPLTLFVAAWNRNIYETIYNPVYMTHHVAWTTLGSLGNHREIMIQYSWVIYEFICGCTFRTKAMSGLIAENF